MRKIEFIDNVDRILEITEFVEGMDISVDYTTDNPILKIGGLVFNEHEYVGKTDDGMIVHA